MFTGEYIHSFDEKGRVIIPSKFRNELGETFYIGKGLINAYSFILLKHGQNSLVSLKTYLPSTRKKDFS